MLKEEGSESQTAGKFSYDDLIIVLDLVARWHVLVVWFSSPSLTANFHELHHEVCICLKVKMEIKCPFHHSQVQFLDLCLANFLEIGTGYSSW
jgi:hypothetical protein